MGKFAENFQPFTTFAGQKTQTIKIGSRQRPIGYFGALCTDYAWSNKQ
jgi:hypothetical protein